MRRFLFPASFIRLRIVLLLSLLVPLTAACSSERSPWENLNYNAVISQDDPGI